MSDTHTTAETLGDSATTTEEIKTPISDGIIDLDAVVEDDADTDEETEGKEKPEAKAEEEPKADDDKPKKLSGAQRAKIREARLLNELQAREREIEELRSKSPAAKAGEAEEKPPREEDFNGDYFAFQRAQTAYEAGKAVRDELRKDRETRETTEHQTKQAEIVRERAVAHSERVDEARETIADFDQVMEGMKGVNVRNEVIEEIMSSEKSALLSYHLAKNPEKLDALNRMSARELAREMGRLEATVQLPEAKKATTAPRPFTAVKGGASPKSMEADLEAYLKKTYGR